MALDLTHYPRHLVLICTPRCLQIRRKTGNRPTKIRARLGRSCYQYRQKDVLATATILSSELVMEYRHQHIHEQEREKDKGPIYLTTATSQPLSQSLPPHRLPENKHLCARKPRELPNKIRMMMCFVDKTNTETQWLQKDSRTSKCPSIGFCRWLARPYCFRHVDAAGGFADCASLRNFWAFSFPGFSHVRYQGYCISWAGTLLLQEAGGGILLPPPC
ncbi:hypothetical protein AUEXF2481DRAFT_144106 [Aureobasidium subglaciale EXF-2481]|uniref:Uncharacterized protein n=1 Tax=Aureobasidium subglaciale (strain EXF-2481) TaxID=1043005 RepID=A0A074YS56_AURSE|nr:uncharacterized protein AUEXF2481DRAFT_144106 [Aureobasidium subglaciale EXF-2481]KER00579.1 hypothetical protein AUEXF2481DRAFT_144106 [Aureobasidium subglaciale EXF-2481]